MVNAQVTTIQLYYAIFATLKNNLAVTYIDDPCVFFPEPFPLHSFLEATTVLNSVHYYFHMCFYTLLLYVAINKLFYNYNV